MSEVLPHATIVKFRVKPDALSEAERYLERSILMKRQKIKILAAECRAAMAAHSARATSPSRWTMNPPSSRTQS